MEGLKGKMINCPSSKHGHDHVTSLDWERNNNILQTMQDRDIVTMED